MRSLPRIIHSSAGLAILALAACARPALNTAPGPLVTDRPDFSESASTVPNGFTQVELGGTYSKDDGVSSVTTGEVLVRAGLTPKVELRITVPSFVLTESTGPSVSGVDDAGFGIKVALHDGPQSPGSFEPALAFIVGTSLPTGAVAFRSSRAHPEVKLIAAWSITERFSFGSNANWGRVDDGSASANEWSGSGSLALSASEKVGVYAEYYAFGQSTTTWQRQSYVNAGLTYLINSGFQLDARVGERINATRDGMFFGLGLARRF